MSIFVGLAIQNCGGKRCQNGADANGKRSAFCVILDILVARKNISPQDTGHVGSAVQGINKIQTARTRQIISEKLESGVRNSSSTTVVYTYSHLAWSPSVTGKFVHSKCWKPQELGHPGKQR